MTLDQLGLFVMLAGFVVGLGAVTVIDIHGFLGRKSSYWTEATIRTHKVTKPLIWCGIVLVALGSLLFFRGVYTHAIPQLIYVCLTVLVLNGCFLSFWVSPRLLRREKEGKEKDLLPRTWQLMITISFLISFLGWWGSLLLIVLYSI